jgi:hypothetical protein
MVWQGPTTGAKLRRDRAQLAVDASKNQRTTSYSNTLTGTGSLSRATPRSDNRSSEHLNEVPDGPTHEGCEGDDCEELKTSPDDENFKRKLVAHRLLHSENNGEATQSVLHAPTDCQECRLPARFRNWRITVSRVYSSVQADEPALSEWDPVECCAPPPPKSTTCDRIQSRAVAESEAWLNLRATRRKGEYRGRIAAVPWEALPRQLQRSRRHAPQRRSDGGRDV